MQFLLDILAYICLAYLTVFLFVNLVQFLLGLSKYKSIFTNKTISEDELAKIRQRISDENKQQLR